MKKILFFLAIAFVGTQFSNSQDFDAIWNDPEANFYEIKAAAQEYFKDKDQGIETDYSRYKRWEYFVEERVYPSGDLSLLNSTKLFQEVRLFEEVAPRLKSQPQWKSHGVDKFDNDSGHYSPGVGRIDRVAVDPTDSRIMYIGAPSGGLWKTYDRGENWTALTDNLPTLGISGIAINPQNPNEIYISSGDGDGGYTYTSGVFKSTDGGETWDITGFEVDLTTRENTVDLVMNPENPNVLWVSSSLGFYKTIDAGETWNRIMDGAYYDICLKPGDPETVYVSQRAALHVSRDGGETFVENDVELSGGILIDVTPANPEIVYIVSGLKGTYKSIDSGATYAKVADLPVEHKSQRYMFAMAVSPTDPNELHFGTFESWKSFDGGLTWVQATKWTWPNQMGYTHCDFHDLVYIGDTLFTCTDGGMSYSTDKGDTYTTCFDNADCTQIYELSVCKTNPEYLMWGSQDNGTYFYDTRDWQAWNGGDGMDNVFDYSNPNIRYGSFQNGTFFCSDHGISQPGKGPWVTPVLIHPFNPQTLYIGNNKVRKSTDGMRTWKVIGSFLNNVNNPDEDWVNKMAISESNPDYLFASKGSRIWRTLNGGMYWTEITDGLPNLNINEIAVHPKNPSLIAVSLSGYNSGKKVYISYDAGLSWTNYSKNLPNIPAKGLAFDDKWNNALYVGMDVGIYYIDAYQEEWAAYGEGLPNVIVQDIEINTRSEQLFIGTHGRGVWSTSTRPEDPSLKYCAGSGIPASESGHIKRVFLGDIESFSSDDGYLETTEQHAQIQRGRYYPLEVHLNETEYQDTLVAWIDWNNDWNFDADEALTLSPPDEDRICYGMVSVPANAEMIMTRLRLRCTQPKEMFLEPCGEHPGEVEDYLLLVTENPTSYCPVISKYTRDEYIRQIDIADLSSRTNGYDYSDYSFKSANVHRGMTVDVRLEPKFRKDTVTQRWRVWIDYNNDGDFLGEGELVLSEGSKDVVNGTITIPDDAVYGNTRMRIMMQRGETPEPCEDISFGEIEDYSINVKPIIVGIDGKSFVRSPNPELRVYPNPTSGMVTLSINPENETVLNMDLVNSAGQVVKQKQYNTNGVEFTQSIDLSDLPNGMYFVVLRTERGMVSQARVIKK